MTTPRRLEGGMVGGEERKQVSRSGNLGKRSLPRCKRSRRRSKPAFAALEVRLPLSGFALQIQDAFLPLRQSVPDSDAIPPPHLTFSAFFSILFEPPGHPPDAMWPPCPRQGHAVGLVSDVYEGGGGFIYSSPSSPFSPSSGTPSTISGRAPGRARHMVRPSRRLPDLFCSTAYTVPSA